MKLITATEAYLEKAKLLSNDNTERVLTRIREKLTRRLDDGQVTASEAVAIQLELEDEQLREWRERMSEMCGR
ncbi:MAG: hypothetical protein WAZ34_02805 [Rhodocyclaceae bacterium]